MNFANYSKNEHYNDQKFDKLHPSHVRNNF